MQLKPIRANITWIYQCPICQSELWVTHEEAKTKGYKVICCNEAHRIQRIHSAKITPLYNEPSLKIVPTENTMENEVVQMLRKLGYTRVKARRLIRKAIDKHGFISEKEQLLKLSLAEDSNETS